MSSLLPQLKDRESLLLMYLAGELPAEDHAQVQRLLAQDPELRRMLEELEATQLSLEQNLRRIDSSLRSPRSAEEAARRTMELLLRPAVAEPAMRRTGVAWRRWRAWASAVAAVLVLSASAWILSRPAAPPGDDSLVVNPPDPSLGEDSLVQTLHLSLDNEYAQTLPLDEADQMLVTLWDTSEDLISFLPPEREFDEGPVDHEIQ